MKTTKQNLTSLEISSFITTIDAKQVKTINGGHSGNILPPDFGSMTLVDDFEIDG